MADSLRIPIQNTDHRPLEMYVQEMRNMGIEPDLLSPLWRLETEQERYLRKLEEMCLNG